MRSFKAGNLLMQARMNKFYSSRVVFKTSGLNKVYSLNRSDLYNISNCFCFFLLVDSTDPDQPAHLQSLDPVVQS